MDYINHKGIYIYKKFEMDHLNLTYEQIGFIKKQKYFIRLG